MAKGDLEHKEPLRSWLKPERGEAQRSDLAGVYGIDNEPAINAIASEAVGMPCDKSHGLLALLDFCHHLIEHLSPRLLCAFTLNKSLGNSQPFSLGVLSQLRKLRFNAHNLSIFILDTFTSVQEIFDIHDSPHKISRLWPFRRRRKKRGILKNLLRGAA
ncbi:MAG: hypothetical protein NTX71_11920 [Candidatus Aureabacteria bacterium]|nr:hypothetical protein [Candidatus Auribacterota bacterium]